MSTFVFANNVSTSLASAISSTATTITLASSTNLPIVPPGSYFPLTLNDKATGTVYEIVYVTAITGVSLTVIRGQEGTTAQSWLVGDYAYGAFTAQSVLTANPGYLLNPMTTAGDLIVGGASGAAQRLGAGTNGQVLTIASGVPSWGTTPGSVSPDTVLARNGTVSHATSQTLTATDSGKIIVYKGTSSAGTFQLPAAASATAGELVYAVYTSGSQPCTLVPGAGGDSAPTISVTTGNILAVVNDGVSSWTIITNTNGNPSTNFKAAPPVATNDVVTLGYASAAYQPAGSYAALAGSSAQAFDVARATTPTKAPSFRR